MIAAEHERAEAKTPDAPKSERVLGAVVPRRLGAPTRRKSLPKSVRDCDHERVIQQALMWQRMAGWATFWEMGATHQGTDPDRAYELAGRMSAIGEQLALAVAAGGEVALWRNVRDSSAEPNTAHEMSMRAMAECQCHFVIGTGHGFANVAAWTLCLDKVLRESLIEALKHPGSAPFATFSGARDDWVSLNRDTCKALRRAAKNSPDSKVSDLIEPVVAVGTGKAWKELNELRGQDFHRWRPQTHGIEGVTQRSPWKQDGNTRSLDFGRPVYEEATGRADETARVATKAMLEIARSMEVFVERWPLASGPLGGPEFVQGR